MRKAHILSTTVLAVKRDDQIAVGGDGQVTFSNTIIKEKAIKLRRLYHDEVIVGFAGAVADAFSLIEKFDGMLEKYQGNLRKAAVELAKEWRTDRILRRLESMMVAASKGVLLLVAGSGEVIEPDDGVVGIGSGGAFAVAAAKALVRHTSLPAREVVEEAMRIAADLCVYTNREIKVEVL